MTGKNYIGQYDVRWLYKESIRSNFYHPVYYLVMLCIKYRNSPGAHGYLVAIKGPEGFPFFL